MENLSANKPPPIRAWAEKNKVRLCFTPTSASWANPRRSSGHCAPSSWAARTTRTTPCSPASFRSTWPGVTPTPATRTSWPPSAGAAHARRPRHQTRQTFMDTARAVNVCRVGDMPLAPARWACSPLAGEEVRPLACHGPVRGSSCALREALAGSRAPAAPSTGGWGAVMTDLRASKAPRQVAGGVLDPDLGRLTMAERVAQGKAARAAAPRESHAVFDPPADRPDPVALLEQQAESRVPELVPIRYGRMLVSPFAFFRGAALPMASDLAGTPCIGLVVQACGDAHLSNFGIFASPERKFLFDVNDFDETLPGPWEWDVKRLAASLEV